MISGPFTDIVDVMQMRIIMVTLEHSDAWLRVVVM